MRKSTDCLSVVFMIDTFAKMDAVVFAWDGLGYPGIRRDGWDVGFGIPDGFNPEIVRQNGLKNDSIWLRKGVCNSEGEMTEEHYYVLPDWFSRGMWSMIYKREDSVKDGHYEAGYEAAQKAAAARIDDTIEVEIPTDPIAEFRAIPWDSDDLGSVRLYTGVDGDDRKWALMGRVVGTLRVWEIPDVLAKELTRKLDAQREGAYGAGRQQGDLNATMRTLNVIASNIGRTHQQSKGAEF